jgi:hypothetical protein
MNDRGPAQALKGRARGVIVGSLIAFGWAAYGASGLPSSARYILMIGAALVSAALIVAGVGLLRRARSMPTATSAQLLASKRTWRWFWLNLVGEIVLLNIAVNLLAAPDLRKYWIPAISIVVGLHFWPMASFFRTRSYWYVGAAMMIVGVLASFLIAYQYAAASTIVCVEAFCNAIILWSALGVGVAAARPERPNPF